MSIHDFTDSLQASERELFSTLSTDFGLDKQLGVVECGGRASDSIEIFPQPTQLLATHTLVGKGQCVEEATIKGKGNDDFGIETFGTKTGSNNESKTGAKTGYNNESKTDPKTWTKTDPDLTEPTAVNKTGIIKSKPTRSNPKSLSRKDVHIRSHMVTRRIDTRMDQPDDIQIAMDPINPVVEDQPNTRQTPMDSMASAVGAGHLTNTGNSISVENQNFLTNSASVRSYPTDSSLFNAVNVPTALRTNVSICREIFVGAIGAQLVYIITSLLFGNIASAIIVTLLCVQSAFCHCDSRPIAYVVNGLLCIIVATIVCVALFRDVSGLEPFQTDEVLRRLSYIYIPLCYSFSGLSFFLAAACRRLERREKSAIVKATRGLVGGKFEVGEDLGIRRQSQRASEPRITNLNE